MPTLTPADLTPEALALEKIRKHTVDYVNHLLVEDANGERRAFNPTQGLLINKAMIGANLNELRGLMPGWVVVEHPDPSITAFVVKPALA